MVFLCTVQNYASQKAVNQTDPMILFEDPEILILTAYCLMRDKNLPRKCRPIRQ